MSAPAGFKPFYRSSYGIQHYRRANDDGTVSYAASQDVGDILDLNKALATENDGWNKARDMRRVASIPVMVMVKWKAELGVDVLNPDHKDAVVKLLNDPDYAYLRTAPGRIGFSNGVMR